MRKNNKPLTPPRPFPCGLVACLLVAGILSAKEPAWKQGKLINLDVGSFTRTTSSPYVNHGQIITHRDRVFTYSVDGGDKIYEAEEVGGPSAKAIHVDVNGPVEYWIDKDHLYIKDQDGKSHKLDLVKTTRKE